MSFYVVNRSGIPLRVTVIRPTRNDPDQYIFAISAQDHPVTDIKGKRIFQRILRDPAKGILVPGISMGATLTYTDRVGVRSKISIDDGGDRILIIETLVN